MDPGAVISAHASEPARRAPAARRRASGGGFTLIELMIIMALMAIIASIAIPSFVRVFEEARLKRAALDIQMIELDLSDYRRTYDELPTTLDELEARIPLDPWGRPYRYFLFQGPGWRGKARKDRFLVPINSEYDLYSVGKDGETKTPLQNKVSWDDFIRANDGAYLGLGRDY
jgi:general secretion pathway protein G